MQDAYFSDTLIVGVISACVAFPVMGILQARPPALAHRRTARTRPRASAALAAPARGTATASLR